MGRSVTRYPAGRRRISRGPYSAGLTGYLLTSPTPHPLGGEGPWGEGVPPERGTQI